uniref:Putative 8.9 kDa family member n=1 Tax=Hyalomma excavatum TaxID=257692 RepID=A0A131XM33_9ACAR
MLCPYLLSTFLWTWFCSSHCKLPPPNKGMLNDGMAFNSSDPCVQYKCHKGVLASKMCVGANVGNCAIPKSARRLPYPACCGQMICTGIK